jgi:peptidoglycan/LPS O-acetylase OafA/YrhL
MAAGVESSFGRRAATPLNVPRDRRSSASGSRSCRRDAADASSARLGRYAGLDLLRLLAALAVVAFHFLYSGPARGAIQTSFGDIAAVAKYGFLGVDLFFLISGFVITASAFGRTWREFAAARVLRLYPAHVFCMTATALVLSAVPGTGLAPTFPQWLANLTMIAPAFGQPFMDGVYWSIVIEIVFYAWVALLVATGMFKPRLLAILAIWLAIATVNEALLQSRAIRIAFCTEYAGLFASGILMQRILAGDRRIAIWALLGFAFALGLAHAFETMRVFARIYDDTPRLSLLLLLHVGIYALFAGTLLFSRGLAGGAWMLAAGGLTYPLYLIHQHAGGALIDRLAPWLGSWPALALVVVILLAFSAMVHLRVEPAGRALLRPALAVWSRPAAPAVTSTTS